MWTVSWIYGGAGAGTIREWVGKCRSDRWARPLLVASEVAALLRVTTAWVYAERARTGCRTCWGARLEAGKRAKTARNRGLRRLSPESRVSSFVMTGRQSSEVETVVLHIGDGRLRARKAADACARDGAEQHIVAALNDAERQLGQPHSRSSRGTYYAIPEGLLGRAV
jgi:hypothetical protein